MSGSKVTSDVKQKSRPPNATGGGETQSSRGKDLRREKEVLLDERSKSASEDQLATLTRGREEPTLCREGKGRSP